VPPLNFDPGFRGDWLDVMLHDPTHPVGLLASHLRAGEDVVAVLSVRSLPTPSQQFFDQHIIQWDTLFRSFRFDLTNALFHDRALWDQNLVVEADVFPADAAQFTSPQSGSEIQQHHHSLSLFQLTVDKLGKLVNAETYGCCLAHAALPNRRNRITICPFIADCVLIQKMH
jgi:hypothetical protein